MLGLGMALNRLKAGSPGQQSQQSNAYTDESGAAYTDESGNPYVAES